MLKSLGDIDIPVQAGPRVGALELVTFHDR